MIYLALLPYYETHSYALSIWFSDSEENYMIKSAIQRNDYDELQLEWLVSNSKYIQIGFSDSVSASILTFCERISCNLGIELNLESPDISLFEAV